MELGVERFSNLVDEKIAKRSLDFCGMKSLPVVGRFCKLAVTALIHQEAPSLDC